jgi:hypothetical protein
LKTLVALPCCRHRRASVSNVSINNFVSQDSKNPELGGLIKNVIAFAIRLRTKWGRGRSAAAVTSQDAANLLIAIAASPLAGPTVKEAVRTCEAYGSLQVLQRASWIDKFPKLGLPTLATLPPSHSLRKALSVVIDGVGKGEIFQIPGREGPRTADFSFAVRFEGPEPWAEIVADGSLGEGKPSQTARLVYTSASAAKEFRKKRPKGPDLHQTRSISFATIRALGCLIARDPT